MDQKVDLLTVELVSDYIENNIYNLSSEEAVLGGSFYIESIRLISDSSGVVDFEDGHISYRAEFDFRIKNAEVFIDNFNILDDNKEKVNFSETGSLIFKNNTWSLVYEEKERPQSVFIRFNDISKCIDNNEIINCSEDILINGGEVRIDGFNESANVLVYNLNFLLDRVDE